MLAALRRLRQTYTYPRGGLQDVARLLADRILAAGGAIATGVRAIDLVREGDRIAAVVADDQAIACQELVWTAPVNALNAALGVDVPILPTVTMRLALLTYDRARRVPRPYVYTYHPDPAMQANRVYYPESIFRELGPADREGLCLEINVATGDGDLPDEQATLEQAVADVARLNLYPASALRQARVVTLPAAMPIYPLDYEGQMAAAMAPVRELANAHAVGRQGGFYFCLTPAAVSQGLKMAAQLLATTSNPGA